MTCPSCKHELRRTDEATEPGVGYSAALEVVPVLECAGCGRIYERRRGGELVLLEDVTDEVRL